MDNLTRAGTTSINIDERHSRAICEEIGWRLRAMLPAERTIFPAHLQVLVDRLAKQDRLWTDAPALSPPIIPFSARRVVSA